jgi:hypothetical protein
MNDASLAERGIMYTVEHPTMGTYKMPAWQIVFAGSAR